MERICLSHLHEKVITTIKNSKTTNSSNYYEIDILQSLENIPTLIYNKQQLSDTGWRLPAAERADRRPRLGVSLVHLVRPPRGQVQQPDRVEYDAARGRGGGQPAARHK